MLTLKAWCNGWRGAFRAQKISFWGCDQQDHISRDQNIPQAEGSEMLGRSGHIVRHCSDAKMRWPRMTKNGMLTWIQDSPEVKYAQKKPKER